MNVECESVSKLTESSASSRQQRCTQYSVKCPQFYKDSVTADIIECYCPNPQDRVVIICNSQQQTEKLYQSEYLNPFSILIHSGLDRRERIKNALFFEENQESKCLITNNIYNSHVRRLRVNLIIFASPSPSHSNYLETIQMAEDLQFVITCYSTKQTRQLYQLERELSKAFIMIPPPDLQSDFGDEPQEIKSQNKYKLMMNNLNGNCNEGDVGKFLEKNHVEVEEISLKKVYGQDERTKTGYIICKNKRSFDLALNLNGDSFQGKPIFMLPTSF